MSDGLTKLRIGISIVFAITLLILLFQLCYVLWRRRRQHLMTGESDESNSTVTTGTTSTPYYSKELLYFLCWKNQAARIEPATTNDEAESDDHHELDVSKLQELYGLFTIKKDKEESVDNQGDDNMERVSSSDDDEVDSMVTIVIHDGEEDIESTPYSTPCTSPPYYTPSPSPSRDGGDEIDQVIRVTVTENN